MNKSEKLLVLILVIFIFLWIYREIIAPLYYIQTVWYQQPSLLILFLLPFLFLSKWLIKSDIEYWENTYHFIEKLLFLIILLYSLFYLWIG